MSKTGLWDTHAHLDDSAFDIDRHSLCTKLGDKFEGIINPGVDEKSSEFAISLAEQFSYIWAAVGWHPENLKDIPYDYDTKIVKWAEHPKVVAIGEIGLDYYWLENESADVQKKILLRQLDLAKQLDLPFIFHDREAHGDSLEIFQKEIIGVRGVFHCFSGSLEMAKELLRRGIYLGFGGTSTYTKSVKIQEVLKYAPRDMILFETDSPYLSPIPFRGKRNNPGYVEYTVKNAALLLDCNVEDLIMETSANAQRLFNRIRK